MDRQAKHGQASQARTEHGQASQAPSPPDTPCMATKGKSSGGVSKPALIAFALLSVFLFVQALGGLPPGVNDEITRWVASSLFVLGALVFGAGGSALWCGLCTAMAVILNPLYPLPLGDLLHGAKILGGAIAGAAVVRHW